MRMHSQLKMFSTRSSDCIKSPDSINFTGDESIYTSWHSLKCSYCAWREDVMKCGRSNHWQIDYIWQQKTKRMKSPLLFVNATVKCSYTNATNLLFAPSSSRLVLAQITIYNVLTISEDPLKESLKVALRYLQVATKLDERSSSIHPSC